MLDMELSEVVLRVLVVVAEEEALQIKSECFVDAVADERESMY